MPGQEGATPCPSFGAGTGGDRAATSFHSFASEVRPVRVPGWKAGPGEESGGHGEGDSQGGAGEGGMLGAEGPSAAPCYCPCCLLLVTLVSWPLELDT